MSQASASEDEAAVERVLGGDVSAFESIVRRWQRPLVSLAYRFCNDRARAEDMAQEAFLRAYRSLATWRRESVFSTWLFALATNVYRTELRRTPTGMLYGLELREPMSAGSDHAALEDEDRVRTLRRAVLALPAKYRDAIILFYFHDMDISAAARTLGIPEG